MSADCPHCRAYRERAEEAEEALRQARAALAAEGPGLPSAWRLTGRESFVFGLLLARPLVSKPLFVMAMEGADAHWRAGPNILDVFICKLRDKLAPFGLQIETVWAQGYRLSPETKAAVRGLAAGVAHIGPPIRRAAPSGLGDAILAALGPGEELTVRELHERLTARGVSASVPGIATAAEALRRERLVADGPRRQNRRGPEVRTVRLAAAGAAGAAA